MKIGDTAWAIRLRGRNDDWVMPCEILITEIDYGYSILAKIVAFNGAFHSPIYHFEPALVFATQEEAQKVFDKIMRQVMLKQAADDEINKIIYSR